MQLNAQCHKRQQLFDYLLMPAGGENENHHDMVWYLYAICPKTFPN